MSPRPSTGGVPKHPTEPERPSSAPQRVRHGSKKNASPRAEIGPPQIGERISYHCEVCDHEADATYKLDPSGAPRWYLGNGFGSRCPRGAECLNSTIDWLTESLDLNLGAGDLRRDPRPYLRHAAGHSRGIVTSSTEPPSAAHIAGWASALLSSDEPLAYLLERRGLSIQIITRYRVGWDRDRGDLTFPAFGADGQVAYLYRRKPISGANMIAFGGPRQPYPVLPQRMRWCLLVAGELDALTGRMYGLPAVTVCGKTLPDHARPLFLDRPTAVMFDVGEESAAERVVRGLGAAGGTACVVRMRPLGLREDGDDLNDYLRAGGSRTRLLQHIKRECRSQR